MFWIPAPTPPAKKNCNCHALFIGSGGVPAVLQLVCGAFPAHFRRAYKKSNQLVLLVGHPLSEFRYKIQKINGFFEFFFSVYKPLRVRPAGIQELGGGGADRT